MEDIGHIYVLMLEDNKWYVGFSRSVFHRIKRHFVGGGSKYTKKHPPIAITKIVAGHKRLERKITLETMQKRGILNVRGAKWSQPTLRLRYKKEIRNALSS